LGTRPLDFNNLLHLTTSQTFTSFTTPQPSLIKKSLKS
jgi:hypothetical protein